MTKNELSFKTYNGSKNLSEQEKKLFRKANFKLHGNKNYENGNKILFAYISKTMLPVGTISYELESTYEAYLSEVFVDTRYRKKGILRNMFAYLLRRKTKLEWSSISSAKEVYERLGGKQTGNLYFTITKKQFERANRGKI